MRAFGESRENACEAACMTTVRELTDHLAQLLRREHEAAADFLVALADFDKKCLWRELGHPSLFSFLNRELKLSKGAAAYRRTAADLVARYPEVTAALRQGKLCITSVIELARVITPENQADVLPRFFGLSKREAMEVVAELKPVEAPPRRTVVTALSRSVPDALATSAPAPTVVASAPARGAAVQLADHLDANSVADQRDLLSHHEVRPTLATTPTDIDPLTADLRRLHLTVSKRLLDKLSAARDALSHSKPGATEEEILEAGLDLILAADAKRKGIVSRPRKTPPPSSPDADHVPAHVRRAVFERDGGRCQVPLESGDVCGSTYRVQLGHIVSRAKGGLPTKENLRCECEAHNQHRADLEFGKAFMDGFRRRSRRRSG